MKINTMLTVAAFAAIITASGQSTQTETRTTTGNGNMSSTNSVRSIHVDKLTPPLPPQSLSINIDGNAPQHDFKDLKSKEVSVEVSASKLVDIYLEKYTT
jgi:hypothetical protein